MNRFASCAGAAALLLAVCVPAFAQDSTRSSGAHLRGGWRRVARAGRPARSGACSRCRCVAGDRLRTADGRVEVLFGDGATLHLDASSVVDFQSDDVIRLLEGRVRLTIPGPSPAGVVPRRRARRVGADSGARGIPRRRDRCCPRARSRAGRPARCGRHPQRRWPDDTPCGRAGVRTRRQRPFLRLRLQLRGMGRLRPVVRRASNRQRRRSPPSTCRRRSAPIHPPSIATAPGGTSPRTATCGIPLSPSDGAPTSKAAGPAFRRSAGPGLGPTRGHGRPIITADGVSRPAHGSGFRGARGVRRGSRGRRRPAI